MLTAGRVSYLKMDALQLYPDPPYPHKGHPIFQFSNNVYSLEGRKSLNRTTEQTLHTPLIPNPNPMHIFRDRDPRA